MQRHPDYFATAAIQAEEPQVFIGEKLSTGKIGASFAAGKRLVFVDGEVKNVRYLSDLRIHPDFRNSTLLARGFRYLRNHVFTPGEWAQTMVLDDNHAALDALTSGRAGLPRYQPAGDYNCYLVPTSQRTTSGSGQLNVRPATKHDLIGIQAFYDREAPRKAFSPVYRFEQLSKDYYRDLKIKDFSLALQDNEVVGMAACWDQTAFKQTRVNSYSRTLGLLRPAYNLVASLSPAMVTLPSPGSYIKSAYAFAIHCRDDDPAILSALIGQLILTARDIGADYLVIGLDARSPLCEALHHWRKRLIHGKHYLVGFDSTPMFKQPYGFYFECGRI